MEFREYKREDFLTTTEPFDLVSDYKGDPFLFAQAIEQMAHIAKGVGVRNFKTLFRDYCKARNLQTNSNGPSRATNFHGQPMALDCGQWLADDAGVRMETPMGVAFACVHPILPMKRLINIDTNMEKLQLYYRKGNFWKELVAEKQTLASANQILSLANAGVAVNSENAKLLVRYLHDTEHLNYDRLEEVNSIGRLGWVENYGFSPYIPQLTFDGDSACRGFYDSVREAGDYGVWLEMAKKVRQESVYGRLLMAASLASVLVKPLNCLPFFVHFWGGTEVGKTVGLMLATSLWADPTPGRYMQSFNSTTVGKERGAAFVCNLPLILDELQMAGNKEHFDKEIYYLCEGVGRTRGNKYGGVDQTPTWSNCILSNGEMPMTGMSSGGGAVNRIIEVECTEKLFANPKEVADICSGNFGFVGKAFVQWLEENDGEFATCKNLFRIYAKELEALESTGKQSMAMALMLTADHIVSTEIIKDYLTFTPKDVAPFLKSKNEVSTHGRAYEYIREVLVANQGKFEGREEFEVWGVMDNKYYYVIKHRFEKICMEGGFHPKAVLSWMRAEGKIAVSKGFTKTKRMNGEAVSCVWIGKEEKNQCSMERISEKEALECPF